MHFLIAYRLLNPLTPLQARHSHEQSQHQQSLADTSTPSSYAASLSCLQALEEIVSRGADPANIRVIAVVAAPPALKLMADAYPGAA